MCIIIQAIDPMFFKQSKLMWDGQKISHVFSQIWNSQACNKQAAYMIKESEVMLESLVCCPFTKRVIIVLQI